jgi:hypothetical protein
MDILRRSRRPIPLLHEVALEHHSHAQTCFLGIQGLIRTDFKFPMDRLCSLAWPVIWRQQVAPA